MKEDVMRYILYGNTTRQSELGGKGRSLAALQQARLPVPDWRVLSPAAFYDSLPQQQRDELINMTDAADIRRVIADISIPIDIANEIETAVAELTASGDLLAVRSSALDEDGAQFSFAGQLDSFLFVKPQDVINKITAVWASGFSDRILAYRREHGLSLIPAAPAVILQRMVNADAAGVAFSADPVTGRRGVAVVSAVYGLASALVSGESDADTYTIDRNDNIIERGIAEKRTAHRQSGDSVEGVIAEPVSDGIATCPALTDAQVLTVAALARQAQQHFGRPQDVEWAMQNGTVYLVQSRPITTLTTLPDPDGGLNLWDNSNIVESYGGVTTPLTFSFARTAYEHVYRQFCRIMGVSEPVISDSDVIFRRMIGLINGRIYYNLLSWYRVLALLPGFTVNRRFMEQMMGVKEGIPDELLPDCSKTTARDRVTDSLRLIRTCVKFIMNHFTLSGSISQFYQRLNDALAPTNPPLEEMRIDELAEYYRSLERKLLTRWDAPLVNDFFAMIFYGLLRRCSEKWCGDSEGTLQNDLISGQGGIISAEPARRIKEMAEMAVSDQNMVNILCDKDINAILDYIRLKPAFYSAYQDYLARFSDRCLEELKLESNTLQDDPMLLLRSIGQLARHWNDADRSAVENDLCRLAEERVARALSAKPLRRALFGWVLRNARDRVRGRENLRFERTRLFGRVRRIFIEIGKRLMSNDRLDDYRDIFYLEINEIIGVIDGTAATVDIRGLTTVRKAEFAGYRDLPAPDNRFETRGMVHQGNSFRMPAKPMENEDMDQRKGIGCCPGVVRGRVRVITDPRNARLEQGEILVAERTDPGWIMLFPAAKGVLVERGSLLSHSAIVAREMRIPAIVSIPGITAWLRDGDIVEFDGSTGVVRRISDMTEAENAQ
jgi:phosphohistidine swiveling domain-containing protein